MEDNYIQLYIGLIAALIMALFTQNFDGVFYVVICTLLNIVIETLNNNK